MSTPARQGDNEASILVRVLCDAEGQLPPEVARYIAGLSFSERDKARMHDLAVRNREGALSLAEEEELDAFGKAGTLLGIRQSRARRTLRITPETRTHGG